MSPMHQNVAGTVSDDVLRALQEMSSPNVRQGLNDALESTNAVDAAQDAMTLQDTLPGHPFRPVQGRANRARDVTADAVPPVRAPLSDRQHLTRSPRIAHAADLQPSRSSRRPAEAKPAPSPASNKSRTAPKPAGTARVNTAPAGPPPAPVARERRRAPDGPSLTELLRREPAAVLKQARGMTPVDRDRLLIVARSAMRTLQTGTYPSSIARPAGDRAHQIIKGIERLRLVIHPTPPAPMKGKKKRKKKGKGGIAVPGAKLAPAVRRQLNDDAHARANAARTRPLDEDERLLLPSRTPIYGGYGPRSRAGYRAWVPIVADGHRETRKVSRASYGTAARTGDSLT